MRLIHALVALSLLLTVPVFCDSSDGDFCVLRLGAVFPTEGFEGFALVNYTAPMNIRGYTVSDGEGTVTFTESITISKYERVYFCKSEPPPWLQAGRYYVYGQNGVVMKGFALADNGDDVYLMKDGEVIDAFVYGDAKAKLGGWEGEPFPKITRKHVAVRTSLLDSNSSADWTMKTPGRSDFSNNEVYDAKVTPLSFPDDQGPLFKALQDAESRIDISAYLISHPKVVSSLLNSMKNGVSVRVMTEGSPAGGAAAAEIKALKALSDAGADVRVMKQIDGYRAYSYTHAKYAVVDEDTVIITSENWQESSFDTNRGWGAVIVSQRYAEYMRAVFESDFCRTNDVQGFSEVYPTAQAGTYGRHTPAVSDTVSYDAKVRPVISPDNSYDTMRSFILSANERVFSEQLDVDYDWVIGDDNPVSWMRTVSDKADCRLLVDVTFDDRNDGDSRDGYGVIDALLGSGIKASSPTFGGMSHNKGVIVDDRVWLGSVNWTYNSFSENREAAVIIDSADVAQYFVALYMSDWETASTEEGKEKEHREPKVDVQNKGQTFMLTVDCDDVCICTWDTDGDGVFESEGRRVMREFPAGMHKVSVSIDDGIDVRVMDIEIRSEAAEERDKVPMKYYPIIIICGAVLCFNAIRWVRRKHDSDKGFHGRRY